MHNNIYVISLLLAEAMPSGEFTYFGSRELHIGDIVPASLRGRTLPGLVTSVSKAPNAKGLLKAARFKLSKLAESEPLAKLRSPVIRAIMETAAYFVIEPSYILHLALPRLSMIKTCSDRASTKPGRYIERIVEMPYDDRINEYSHIISSNPGAVICVSGAKYARLVHSDLMRLGCEASIVTPSALALCNAEAIIVERESRGFVDIKATGIDTRVYIRNLARNLDIPLYWGDVLVSI